MSKVLKLSEFREKREEEASLDLELSDGTVLRIPPPDLWPDKCMDVLALQRKGEADDSDLAKAIWGAANWKKYVADGGTTAMFSRLLIERFQMTTGESSASSSS
jgi:hypothetical protein